MEKNINFSFHSALFIFLNPFSISTFDIKSYVGIPGPTWFLCFSCLWGPIFLTLILLGNTFLLTIWCFAWNTSPFGNCTFFGGMSLFNKILLLGIVYLLIGLLPVLCLFLPKIFFLPTLYNSFEPTAPSADTSNGLGIAAKRGYKPPLCFFLPP